MPKPVAKKASSTKVVAKKVVTPAKQAVATKKAAAAAVVSKKTAKTAKAAKPVEKKKKIPLTKAAKKIFKKESKKRRHLNPLFEKKAKVFAIGRDVNPTRDLTRYVLWPKYIRLQRQRRILYSRLRVPPAIHQFSKTLEKNTAIQLFRFIAKYRPESKRAKKMRLVGQAKQVLANRKAAREFHAAKRKAAKEAKATNAEATPKKALTKEEKVARKKLIAAKKAAAKKATPHKYKKTLTVKCGINHVTSLVEQKKASLVIIANDVDPIELVVWLPTLCRKMQVPYCIVKNKARLGKVVGKKNATCLAITKVHDKHKDAYHKLLEAINANYTTKVEESRRQWGGGRLGMKSRHALRKKQHAIEVEKAKVKAK